MKQKIEKVIVFATMWAFGANNRKAKLDEERQLQEQLIKEQLKTLELEKELRELEKEKITQKGFVQVARRKIRQEEGEHENNHSSSSEHDDQQKDKKNLTHIEMARQGYQQLVDAIIRPPRAKYKASEYEETSTVFSKHIDLLLYFSYCIVLCCIVLYCIVYCVL